MAVSLCWIQTDDKVPAPPVVCPQVGSIKRMNLNFAPFPQKLPYGSARLCAVVAMTVCLLILSAVPALAEPVKVNQVVQTLSSTQGVPDLRLKTLVAQDPATTAKNDGPKNGPRKEAASAPSGEIKTESILSGVSIVGGSQPIGVEEFEEAEVDGTICDCGEILVAGGAFPKWPFLFLAAVPLAFIHECDNCDENPSTTPTPTPTPTPPSNPTPTPRTVTETPEPASLILLGSGLVAAGAGLRRRYGKTKSGKAEEEE